MKGEVVFMKKLEMLSIPDPKDVLKLRLARTISSSVISGKVKVYDLVLILYAPSIRGFSLKGISSFKLFPILQKYSFIMFGISNHFIAKFNGINFL